MKEETAKRVAKWWADHLRVPALLDMGAREPIEIMTNVMAMDLQDTERAMQTSEQIDAFEAELARVLECEEPSYGDTVSFGVDYHPCQLLDRAAKAVGLELGMTTLPWKTHMNIKGDTIRAKLGYSGEYKEV